MLNIDNGYYKQLLNSQDSVEKAMELIDGVSGKCLFIIDQERKLLGSLTDGDIEEVSLEGSVLKVMF